MSKQFLVRLVCMLAALSLGMVACEPKEETQPETTAAADDGKAGAQAAKQAPATQAAPTVDERREALIDSAREQAAEDVTEENAAEVATRLESELDEELAEMEKAEMEKAEMEKAQ